VACWVARRSRLLVTFGLATACAAGAAGQVVPVPAPPPAANPSGRKYPARVYQTVRLEGAPPAIDGSLDDAAWRQGEWAGNYTQQIPTEAPRRRRRPS
jgi:hypothetical protein